MVEGTGIPMSQGASRQPEPLASPAVPPLTYQSIATAPNPDPGANRFRSDPLTASPHPSRPIACSSSTGPSCLTGRPQSTNPLNPAASCRPAPTTPEPSALLSDPLYTDPKQPFSQSTKRPSQETNDATNYNSEGECHREGAADGEKETGDRLTTLYVDPEDHPAYKELEATISQSQDDQDRWKACKTFHERYRSFKGPIEKLDAEIEEHKRKLGETEATRDDKESNLDALVLIGTSLMVSQCERFGQVQRLYNEARRKRPRNSGCAPQSDLQATGEDWSDFLDDHGKASRELQQCAKVLDYISKTWGGDKIRYYGWATKTWTFCKLLKAAASAVPRWREAGKKLNRIRNYRDRKIGNPIASGKRSISWKDLECLSKWKWQGAFEMPSTKAGGGKDRTLPYAALAPTEFNPERLGFDEFGILVVKAPGPDGEPVITFAAPPWGMAQSPSVGQEVDEQTGDPRSLLGTQDGDPMIDHQDKTLPITLIRGSARLATRQPILYSDQLAPINKPLSHRVRKRPDLEKHVFGDDEEILAPVHRRQPKCSMVDAKIESDQSLREAFIVAKAADLNKSSPGSQFLKPRDSVPVVSQAAELGQTPPEVTPEGFYTDPKYDKEFKRLALDELKEAGDKECWGAENSRSCYQYLSNSDCPTIDPSQGSTDAFFSTLDEAEELVNRSTPRVPIFTRCNAGRWKTNLRPTVDYLMQAEKVQTKKVYIQKYSLPTEDNSYAVVTLWDLISHFVREDHGVDGLELWNALELENHLPQCHVPQFLRNNNCCLLNDMRQRAENRGIVKRGRKAKKAEGLPGKDPLHFALIADGGMNTYPHSDSHGYSTFLTVQEGELIFGWLPDPDDDTWDAWAKDPRSFQGGKWCYLVLKPGDSVYLPSGTPHYVVRRKGAQTFILGGHVLQWSNLQGWASLLRRQIDNPIATNEHMAFETVRRYVEIAGGLVVEAIEDGNDRLEYLGGSEAAKQTLQVLKDVQRMVESKQNT